MNFWKTSFWAVIATVARLVSQFVVGKLIAIFAGVGTFGVFGQFQSFITIVQLGTGGIVRGGVTKYAAEYHDKPELLQKLIYTAVKFAFYASLVVGLVIVLFSRPLSFYLFQNYQYRLVLILFGLTLFGYTLNQMFLSVFNGLNQMVKYASIAVFGAFFSILLIGGLTYEYKTEGALVGFVLSQLCLFVVGCFYIRKLPVQIKLLRSRIDNETLKKLLYFSLMAVTSAISLPIAEMVLRGYVAHHSSWTNVGYWQAMLKVSDGYLLLLTMIISTYALPKYARISDNKLLKKEVFGLILKIVPIVTLLALLIYLCRNFVILTLFTNKFLPMQKLFRFQLIGDVIKVASWVVANVLLARAQVKVYVVFEISFTIIYVLLSILFYERYGIVGLTIAFAINYTLYFLVVSQWFLRFIKKQ